MPETGPTLRAMTAQDLDGVAAIEAAAYARPWDRRIFADCLRVGYRCRVAEVGGRVVGYLLFSVVADECHILNLCVDPAEQGGGIGRALLVAGLQEARDAGAGRVFLEVRRSNRAALGLYRGTGFEECGLRPGYYPGPEGAREDALVLARDL